MNTHVYPIGTLIEFEEGEYSDRALCGLFVTLGEFKLAEQINAFREQFKPKHDWDTADPPGFLGWCVAQQFLAPVSYSSAHIGSYGRLEL